MQEYIKYDLEFNHYAELELFFGNPNPEMLNNFFTTKINKQNYDNPFENKKSFINLDYPCVKGYVYVAKREGLHRYNYMLVLYVKKNKDEFFNWQDFLNRNFQTIIDGWLLLLRRFIIKELESKNE